MSTSVAVNVIAINSRQTFVGVGLSCLFDANKADYT